MAADTEVAELLSSFVAGIRALALELTALVRDTVPDALEDLDHTPRS